MAAESSRRKKNESGFNPCLELRILKDEVGGNYFYHKQEK
jgi:hypothetical protein